MNTDPELFYFKDDGSIPNNPELPLVLYRRGLEKEDRNPSSVKRLLNRNGWTGAWINGIYSYHHYHSTAHEVLVVFRGSAEVQFGGKQGEILEIQAGDAVVIPAGVGHCRKSSTADFRVVGAYPDEQSWDLCTGEPDERPQVLENIGAVAFPSGDPLTGTREPLLECWE